jgi:hypothetical protein
MDCYIQTVPFMIGHNSLLSFYRWLHVPLYGTDGIYVIVMGNGIQDTLDFIGTGGALDGRSIQSDWFSEKYSLAQYTPGDTFQIRISFISDNDGDINEGFYIDDFNVENITLIEEYTHTYAGRPLFTLSPNPFRETISMRIQTTELLTSTVPMINIYDCSGRLVKQLSVDTDNAQPSATAIWDGYDAQHRKVAAGVYFVQFKTGDERITEKAILVR